MSRAFPARVASVRFAADGAADASRAAAALLAASPRVAAAGPGLCRADARGWERRGGEVALARALREAASAAGLAVTGVGIADVPVAADAAALLAAGREERVAIVPPGRAARFLAPLPLAVLPLPPELLETLRALGLRRAGDLASRSREELEARFGPEGLRAHRLACGEDGRPLRALRPDDPPEAELELEPPVASLEPLLFVLRHLLARVCADLATAGRGAARLALDMVLEDGTRRTASIVPARPTRRDGLLHDLCRAALERATDGEGRLPAPVAGLAVRVSRVAALDARQGDLFRAEWRDPMAAAGVLSRLRARLGEEAVVWPAPRPDARPETRNAWRPVEMRDAAVRERSPAAGTVAAAGPVATGEAEDGALPGTLRLLPEPEPVRVRTEAGRPVELRDGTGCREVAAAEGPERLSGDWWKDPWRREYFRLCTAEGELLWAFREVRRDGALRWWLHGWWD
jgi:protein ImuB